MFLRKKRSARLKPPQEVRDAGIEAPPDSHCADDTMAAPLDVQIIYNAGNQNYAVAVGILENTSERVVAIRWNGDDRHNNQKDMKYLGTPSWSAARWFVLPKWLWPSTLAECERLERNSALEKIELGKF